MKKSYLIIVFICAFLNLNAQITQVVRGQLLDQESQIPLIGVNIVLDTPDGETIGNITDIDGYYRLDKVPLGRQTITFSYLGYKSITLDNIIVTSGKEVILNLTMEESSVALEAVTVTGTKRTAVNNEMATVSARTFSVEETNRYAGSRGEPARMASNFAGVQGADDSRNDIIIRGNTPNGVLWRLEGINIPNPNHFSIPGTGGGPVTILNNKYLSNSDFFTGAFPAEYGNGIAGVFDLKMRNGNNEKFEFSGQLGFLGTELMAEGPINKKKRSSFLATYRYSTLTLFSFLGVNVGTDAIPKYQDGAFKLNFPGKGGSNISIWGIGGNSNIDIILSEKERPDTSTLIFGSNDRDQHFSTNMGVIGINYSKPINSSTYFKIGMAASTSGVVAKHEQIFRHTDPEGFYKVDSLPQILGYHFTENKYSAYAFVNRKINSQSTIKFGITADMTQYDYLDSARQVIPGINPDDDKTLAPWNKRWNARGNTFLVQPYVQYKYKPSEKLTFVAGISTLYYSLNKNSLAPIEPRLGISYDLNNGQKLSLGLGMHSQIQSPYLYFYGNSNIDNKPIEENKDMGLTKSNHIVLSYDNIFAKVFRLKAEVYYQQLNSIPVGIGGSSYSLINAGSGFSRLFPGKLANEGKGQNYGLELTLERFFSKGYYFLVTGSLFDSKYKGSDDVWRNTSFNGKYAINVLVAKEFTFKNKSAFNIGAKTTSVGGRWYGPVDEVASAQNLEIVYHDATVNTQQFRPYFRADLKLSYRWNRPKVTHEFSLDLVNIFNTKNILTLTYAPDSADGEPIKEEYQLGFLPIFYYKIDF